MPHLVVLNPASAALEAARAIESSNLGVFQGQGRVVGIVTDRDLTIRMVGQGPRSLRCLPRTRGIACYENIAVRR